MYMLLLLPIVIFSSILIQGFFANSEMAMVSSNKIRLQYLAGNDDKRAIIINKLLNRPDRLFATTLLGVNLSTIIATTLAELYFHSYIFESFPAIEHVISAEILVLLIIEPLILIFGELQPMSIARKYPNSTALRNAYIIRLAYIVLFPLMLITSSVSRTINKFFKSSQAHLSREELQLLVTGKFTKVNDKTQEYIKDFFNINELSAEDVMVHLNKVIAVDDGATVGQVKKVISETNHSRIPVFKNDIFNIIATVHVGNIIGVDDNEPIMNYTEKLYIIPSSKPVIQILSELKRNRKYIGIVVDEYGAVCGTVTLKDILAEIIGELTNDLDTYIADKDEGSTNIFDTAIFVEDFYEITGIDFRDEEADTLGGVVNLALGRIGTVGEKFSYQNYRFEIVEATDRLVKKVKLLGHKKSE